jgi:aryl-alcohol dehydrogenase-like predicted oxidoreductase
MRTNHLGPVGPAVSEIGLGTMTFGVETSRDEARRQLDRFVAAGGTLVDTANVYGGGAAESIIGEWLALRRPEGVVVATKGRFDSPEGVSGASRRAITAALDGSLRRLGTETIDLYYVHGWDPAVPVEETLGALTDAVAAGKVRWIGWSNTTGWQLQRILDVARTGEFVVPVVSQPQYNLLDRGIEWELLPLCLDEGVAVVPWSPLGGGWLTGKYRREVEPSGATRLGEDPARGVEAYDARNTDRVWAILDAAEDVARQEGRWLGEIALLWLMQRPGVASVLVGARTVEQLEQSLAAAGGSLSPGSVARLTAASAPGLPPYPYGMIESYCDETIWGELGTKPPLRGARDNSPL